MDMVPMAKEAGVEPIWMSRSSWVPPRALANLAWHLIRYRPEILYTLTVVPNIWGRVFAAIARVPVVVASWRSLFPKQYESLMWRLSTRVICNADALKEIMIQSYGVDPRRIAVIPNTVNPDFFSPDTSEKAPEPTVLYIGRLVPDKDPLTLVEGFRLTAEHIPEARFNIIGNGHLKKKVEAYIRRHSLQSRIAILPGRPDIRPDLKRAWVFAMASQREASPNVILEAMATELPIVAPRVGGIPELIVDGETGLLFDQSDPRGMAEALTNLLQDESRRLAMGRKGRDKVIADHSMNRMITETQRVFLEAADEAMR